MGEKDYKKAVEYKSSITQKMEGAADQCVQKLLISQSNTELQLCLQNELSNKSYNNRINNNINIWHNFKSTYSKKEISFINGH